MTDLWAWMERQRAVCHRCGKRFRRRDIADWNMKVEGGRIVALSCMGCLTAEENAEAEINDATVDYSRAVVAVDPSVVRRGPP